MNLHKLHKNPKSLDHHDDQHLIPSIAWDKYWNNPKEQKKKEKMWARDPNTAYRYALYLKKPFPLGEPAIAKDAHCSFQYADNIVRGPFKLGEPAIAKDAYYSYAYARNVLKDRFPPGEPAIATDGSSSCEYALAVLKGPFPLGEPAILKDSEYSGEYNKFLNTLKT